MPSPEPAAARLRGEIVVAPLATCWACDGASRGDFHARDDCPVAGRPLPPGPPKARRWES